MRNESAPDIECTTHRHRRLLSTRCEQGRDRWQTRLVRHLPCCAIGTQGAACPQPAEADIRPLDGNSRFNPLVGWAKMHRVGLTFVNQTFALDWIDIYNSRPDYF